MDVYEELLISDLESSETKHAIEQGFWEIVFRKGLFVYVCMFAPDDRSYVIELDCNEYGNEPIAGRFVDKETFLSVESAWPRGNNTFAQWIKWEKAHLFICWDQDRLGIKHHPDWKQREAWKKTKIKYTLTSTFSENYFGSLQTDTPG